MFYLICASFEALPVLVYQELFMFEILGSKIKYLSYLTATIVAKLKSREPLNIFGKFKWPLKESLQPGFLKLNSIWLLRGEEQTRIC